MDRNKIGVVLLSLFLSESVLANTFRFYVKNEPTLNPSLSTTGESNYVHATLYRGLTRFTDEGLLIFENAERCRYIIDTDIKCKLRENLKFSDGSELKASDYAHSFLNYLKPGSSINVAQLLFSIKNAKKYFLGRAQQQDVGIKVISEREIQFLLEEPDREFLDKLSHPLLVPYVNDAKFNGPYYLSSIVKGKKWELKSNPYYQYGNKKRPPIEINFVSDDSTALNLYEKSQIDFLWRLPSDYIDKFKNRKDFVQVPVARLDYIGFNQKENRFFSDINNRKQFATHIDFNAFQKLLQAKGPAGCPGLGNVFIKADQLHCQVYDSNKIKLKLNQTPHFNFSQLGGDDIAKQATWFKNQWKVNLNVNVNLKSFEQKTFVKKLKEDTPDIFRKGVPLQWPSCAAALNHFKSDSPENYTGFNDSKFDQMLAPFKQRKLTHYEKDTICAAAVKYLFLDKYVGIPLGEIHFTMLINPRFKNVKINNLNQLDLSELEYINE